MKAKDDYRVQLQLAMQQFQLMDIDTAVKFSARLPVLLMAKTVGATRSHHEMWDNLELLMRQSGLESEFVAMFMALKGTAARSNAAQFKGKTPFLPIFNPALLPPSALVQAFGGYLGDEWPTEPLMPAGIGNPGIYFIAGVEPEGYGLNSKPRESALTAVKSRLLPLTPLELLHLAVFTDATWNETAPFYAPETDYADEKRAPANMWRLKMKNLAPSGIVPAEKKGLAGGYVPYCGARFAP